LPTYSAEISFEASHRLGKQAQEEQITFGAIYQEELQTKLVFLYQEIMPLNERRHNPG